MGHDAYMSSGLWVAGRWVPFCHHWNKSELLSTTNLGGGELSFSLKAMLWF